MRAFTHIPVSVLEGSLHYISQPFRRLAIMPIRKAELDQRIYDHRVVQVAGGEDGKEEVGLRCLFVQDKDTEKAAASMCVHVGAMYDPRHRPGLAHFCGMLPRS